VPLTMSVLPMEVVAQARRLCFLPKRNC